MCKIYTHRIFMLEEKLFSYKYPHPAVTTDCVIFGYANSKLQVLLIERGIEPYKGEWALPGGFLRLDESAIQGALRELCEETGLKGAFIRQFHTFSDPNRDPRERVISIAYYALVRICEVKGGDDAASAQWFPINEVPHLAFDHNRILRMALAELRKEIYFNSVGFELLPEKFTMSELQKLYETILDTKFDRRNFYKKMTSLDIIEPVEEDQLHVEEEAAEENKAIEPPFQAAVAPEQKSLRFSREIRGSIASLGISIEVNADELSATMIDSKQHSDSNTRTTTGSGSRRRLFFTFNRKKYNEMKKNPSKREW